MPEKEVYVILQQSKHNIGHGNLVQVEKHKIINSIILLILSLGSSLTMTTLRN